MKNDNNSVTKEQNQRNTPASPPTKKVSPVEQANLIIKKSKTLARKVGHTMDITRGKHIPRFTPKPPIAPTKQSPTNATLKKPTLASRTNNISPTIKTTNQKTNIAKTPKTIKEAAIAENLGQLDEKPLKKERPMKKQRKILNIITAIISLLVIIGYIIYLYLPSFSVRIASMQAGIKATYPEYRPEGYKINGPVTYKDSEVTIDFHANTGNTKFSINQSKSSLDSSAVKLMAEKASKGQISTTSERGLTIFSYGNNAMWVNGGILYSITGDATLSSDQIRRIATSL